MKKFSGLFLTLLFVLSIGTALAEENKISHNLLQVLKDNETIPVIIVLKDQPVIASRVSAASEMQAYSEKSQKALKGILEKARGENKASNIESLWIVNAIAVKASPELIYSIASRNDVASIQPVRKMHSVEDSSSTAQFSAASVTWGVSKINAPRVWDLGINGSGINVSIIDTGINGAHPDIAGRVIKWVDFVNFNNNVPYDDAGHGTHVAGTVGGNGKDGIETGVAPGVNLFAVKVLDATGSGNESDVINGIQWSIENKANIISMSLGTDQKWATNCDGDNYAMAAAINNAVNAGVVVVAAAGNHFSGYPPGVSSPGCIQNAIAVGAVDSNDVIAGFSGVGYAMLDHGVVAPGVDVTSLDYQSTGYLSGWSGTSMATPHVSGAAALVLQSNPGLSPLQLKQRLGSTSVDLGTPGKDYIYGAGRIDAYSAIFAPQPTGGVIYGTVFNDSNRNKIKDAGEAGLPGWTISLSGFVRGTYVSKTAITDADGNYSFTNLQAGTYMLREGFKPGWIATTPSYYSVTLGTGDTVKRDFGNRRII